LLALWNSAFSIFLTCILFSPGSGLIKRYRISDVVTIPKNASWKNISPYCHIGTFRYIDHGSLVPWFLGSRLPGFPASRLPGFPASRLPGFPASRLPGFPASRLPGFPASRRRYLFAPAPTMHTPCQWRQFRETISCNWIATRPILGKLIFALAHVLALGGRLYAPVRERVLRNARGLPEGAGVLWH
jgi:hypothetical protein